MKAKLFLLALCLTSHALALPEGVRSKVGGGRGQSWAQWGSGEMTWFGLALYRATLWVASPHGSTGGREAWADGAAGPGDDTPLALALEYRRDIPAGRIVQASVDEMRRLGASSEQLQRWEGEMRRVFPDVRKGDVLTGVYLPGQGARFFHQERELGEVRDVEFARRFFAIWLDPRTSAPDVRAALLRQRGG